MRNTLSELPVLLCCLWGGLAAGLFMAAVRIPRRLYTRSRRGRREGTAALILLGVLDAFSAAAVGAAFILTLIHANGGEPRAFAVAAFALGLFVPQWAAGKLI